MWRCQIDSFKGLVLPTVGLVAIVAGYFLIDFNALYQSFKGEAKFTIQDSKCDLHKKSCLITIADGTSFELEIEPKRIPLMEPLKFKIKSNNPNLKELYLNIYATNMFMGDFRLPIRNMGSGDYEATGTLPTCPVGDMQWNADIRVEKLNETIGARFKFTTDR